MQQLADSVSELVGRKCNCSSGSQRGELSGAVAERGEGEARGPGGSRSLRSGERENR